MDRSQKQFVEERINKVSRDKGSKLWRHPVDPKIVKRARRIVRRHERLVTRERKRGQAKLATSIAKCRRALVFGDAKKALAMIDAVARRQF